MVLTPEIGPLDKLFHCVVLHQERYHKAEDGDKNIGSGQACQLLLGPSSPYHPHMGPILPTHEVLGQNNHIKTVERPLWHCQNPRYSTLKLKLLSSGTRCLV